MTKPREKTREELTAEIEDGKKKIRQFENREKMLRQKLSVEERKARNHRLCKRGGFMESLVPELIAMPDEDAKAFLRLALTSEPAQEFLKKRAKGERGVIPLEQRAHLYTLAGVCALPRAYLRTGNFHRAPIWRLCRNKGLPPLRRLRGYPCTPTKTVHPPRRLYYFCGFYYSIREVIPIAIYHCNIGIVSRGKGKP